MEEKVKTVAELTIFYKKQRLASLIFDQQETADKFVESITHFFNEKGRKEFSFSGEIKNVYTLKPSSGNYMIMRKAMLSPKVRSWKC
ncbi:MAG: hypothetical protein K0M50_19330 [Prolixibacteraceae bacterium]|nr:hypothetical protein [Prolixibacteraceae bacterium]